MYMYTCSVVHVHVYLHVYTMYNSICVHVTLCVYFMYVCSDIKDSATECGVCVTVLSIHPHGKAGPKMEHHSRLDSEGWVVWLYRERG